MITAKKINQIVKIGAVHVLYSRDGRWYNHLKSFPGVLFDINGYVTFTREAEYTNNKFLQHGKELNVSGSISQIPGYKKYTEHEKRQILSIV